MHPVSGEKERSLIKVQRSKRCPTSRKLEAYFWNVVGVQSVLILGAEAENEKSLCGYLTFNF